MDIERFRAGSAGRLIQIPGADYWAFVPHPLPPQLPFDIELVQALSEADRALGTLAGLGRALPNPDMFVVPFIRREAVLSSRIEGTQADLSDLYAYEASQIPLPGMPALKTIVPDVREVSNYVSALEYGLKHLGEGTLNLDFIRALHARLMQDIPGPSEAPGTFRNNQNWIGTPGSPIKNAVYVPPPMGEMHSALQAFDTYLHAAPEDYPPLVRLALIHYQFEAIHPFLDGNGRVGRLIVALLLYQWELLPQPLLYLSAYFERYRRDYYEGLLRVSRDGSWKEWVIFFLRGVTHQSRAGTRMAESLQTLRADYRRQIREGYKRVPGWIYGIVDLLFEMPYITSQKIHQRFEVTRTTANNTLNRLEEMGIVREVTGRQRSRVYVAHGIFDALDAAVD